MVGFAAIVILPSLYALSLTAAFASGSACLRNGSASPTATKPVRVTYWVAVTVLCGSLLQAFDPSLLPALERNRASIVSGEWWRMLSALFVQDGGITGTVFNLVALLALGRIAERLLGARRWLVVFFLGAILSEGVALWWQPVGAGNSVANFSLAGASCVLCARSGGPSARFIPLWVALGGFAALLMLRDIHGAAAVFGGLVALLFRSR